MDLRRAEPLSTLVLTPSELDVLLAGRDLDRGADEKPAELVLWDSVHRAAQLGEQLQEKQQLVGQLSGRVALGETGPPIPVPEE